MGIPKVKSVEERLKVVNPDIQLNLYQQKLTIRNAGTLMRDYDLIVECCDNYITKFLINDICVHLNKAISHGSVQD